MEEVERWAGLAGRRAASAAWAEARLEEVGGIPWRLVGTRWGTVAGFATGRRRSSDATMAEATAGIERDPESRCRESEEEGESNRLSPEKLQIVAIVRPPSPSGPWVARS